MIQPKVSQKTSAKKGGISNFVASPLYVIITLFTTLSGASEITIGVAIPQTQGNIQLILTIFSVTFPVMICFSFFIILIWKPYVFYAPKDFGENININDFVRAMGGPHINPSELIIKNVEKVKTPLISKENLEKNMRSMEVKGVADSPELKEKIKEDVQNIISIFQNEANDAIKNSFISIDSNKFLSGNGEKWEELYIPDMPAKKFIDLVSTKLQPYIAPFSYGIDWVIKDTASGRIYTSIKEDDTLSSVGFCPGQNLIVTSI